jgi:hypothetical protein
MKSGKICQTSISTVGTVKDQDVVNIDWNISDGVVVVDGEVFRGHMNNISWSVPVRVSSLDKVITFLQRVRKETRKKRGS